MGTKKELSIKSRLLFNSLNTNFNIVINNDYTEVRRKKALGTIISTYQMVLNPFIADEELKYRTDLSKKIVKKQGSIERMIEMGKSPDTIKEELLPIFEHLKQMVRTCKCNMDVVNNLW